MIVLERYDERILVFTKESACGITALRMNKEMSPYSVQLIYSSAADLALK